MEKSIRNRACFFFLLPCCLNTSVLFGTRSINLSENNPNRNKFQFIFNFSLSGFQFLELFCLWNSFLYLWKRKPFGQRKHSWCILHCPFIFVFEHARIFQKIQDAKNLRTECSSRFLSFNPIHEHGYSSLFDFNHAHFWSRPDFFSCMAFGFAKDSEGFQHEERKNFKPQRIFSRRYGISGTGFKR